MLLRSICRYEAYANLPLIMPSPELSRNWSIGKRLSHESFPLLIQSFPPLWPFQHCVFIMASALAVDSVFNCEILQRSSILNAIVALSSYTFQ